MAYINLAGGLKVNTADAVDSRLVLFKAEMLSLHYNNDESRPESLRGKIFQLPDQYLCICKDDGQVYLYNVNNEEDLVTGKFRELQAGSDLQFEVTHSQLLSIRDQGLLIPGAKYRIVDFVTKVTQVECRSAEHPFDIIVEALNESILSENALACLHENDEYFSRCNLNAWKLKYCLDNDRDRFAWADEANGKGVIYEMEDEWGNKLPYDFKNVQFKRYLVEVDTSSYSDFEGLYVGCKNLNGDLASPRGYTIPDDEDFRWCYTFNWFDEDSESVDYSIEGNLTLMNDEGFISGCHHNIFGVTTEYDLYPEEEEHPNRLWLGNNVIWDSYENEDGISYGFNSNTIGNYFRYNTIGNGFNYNTIGNDFYANTIGNDFYSNTIGNGFNYNTIGNYFNSNTIGNYFSSNTIGNYFSSNTIGNGFSSNTIGNDFYYNTIGNGFSSNTIGNYFNSNTIGNYFNYNTIGNDFYSNTIGNYFNSNTIGNYFRYNTIREGIKFINITTSTEGSGSNYLQYVDIKNGVHGASSSNRKTIQMVRNLDYCVTYEPVDSERIEV